MPSFYWSVLSPTWAECGESRVEYGKYRPGKTQYLDIFHALVVFKNQRFLEKKQGFVSSHVNKVVI